MPHVQLTDREKAVLRLWLGADGIERTKAQVAITLGVDYVDVVNTIDDLRDKLSAAGTPANSKVLLYQRAVQLRVFTFPWESDRRTLAALLGDVTVWTADDWESAIELSQAGVAPSELVSAAARLAHPQPPLTHEDRDCAEALSKTTPWSAEHWLAVFASSRRNG